MSDRIQVRCVIEKGYGVASGQAQNLRFPQGTIEMQKPFFRDRGLDLNEYFAGTINLSIAPSKYEIKQTKYTFKQIKWSPNDPAEDFSFFDCQLLLDRDKAIDGLIYYPHPDTKPEHFQAPDILEVMMPFIHDLTARSPLILAVDSQQIRIDLSSSTCHER
ncbi:hypothetical protein [Chamaesiphon sp.]|uniref:hypothetical protein n=1 Tax=Chamaesiphon sp. TaxID=2814140 RepID=UPI003593F321